MNNSLLSELSKDYVAKHTSTLKYIDRVKERSGEINKKFYDMVKLLNLKDKELSKFSKGKGTAGNHAEFQVHSEEEPQTQQNNQDLVAVEKELALTVRTLNHIYDKLNKELGYLVSSVSETEKTINLVWDEFEKMFNES